MLQKMMRKNKKGFTLIELIVVIAILAILAAIAIPRFSGFTDKAKIAADEEYAALVGNAAVVLLAAGDIKFDTTGTTADITISTTDGTVAIDTTNIDDDSVTAFPSAMDALVKAQKPVYYKTALVVTLTSTGEHSIKTKTK